MSHLRVTLSIINDRISHYDVPPTSYDLYLANLREVSEKRDTILADSGKDLHLLI